MSAATARKTFPVLRHRDVRVGGRRDDHDTECTSLDDPPGRDVIDADRDRRCEDDVFIAVPDTDGFTGDAEPVGTVPGQDVDLVAADVCRIPSAYRFRLDASSASSSRTRTSAVRPRASSAHDLHGPTPPRRSGVIRVM